MEVRIGIWRPIALVLLKERNPRTGPGVQLQEFGSSENSVQLDSVFREIS